MKIFAYTMVYDTGFAPSVDKGVLSLACCKTFLRYKIANELLDSSDDIYVVGLCSKQMSGRHNYDNDYFPVYIAKISDCVKTDYYYSKRAYKPDPILNIYLKMVYGISKKIILIILYQIIKKLRNYQIRMKKKIYFI